jgi:hypothetical protein
MLQEITAYPLYPIDLTPIMQNESKINSRFLPPSFPTFSLSQGLITARYYRANGASPEGQGSLENRTN